MLLEGYKVMIKIILLSNLKAEEKMKKNEKICSYHSVPYKIIWDLKIWGA